MTGFMVTAIFVVLANILNRPLPLAFLVHDQVAMARTYELVLDALKYKFTRLHAHLTSPALDLTPAEYLEPIFRCLFTHHLPYDLVQRVWDVFVFEGDKTLIRAAIAILGRLESPFEKSKVLKKDEKNEIQATILGRAQGVFLWVHLVVRSLIEGLLNLDPISILRKRLREFPKDLYDFFRLIFESLDPIYRPKTAQMFQATLAATEGASSLTTLTYWYLVELDEAPDLALTMPMGGNDGQTIADYSAKAGVRINGRCKGLLEVTGRMDLKQKDSDGAVAAYHWYKVGFLHRTVVDFLETTELQCMLEGWQQGEHRVAASAEARLAKRCLHRQVHPPSRA